MSSLRCAIVTGGGRGIGAVIARTFAADAASVTGVAKFSASPDSDFMTGQPLVVDGGSFLN